MKKILLFLILLVVTKNYAQVFTDVTGNIPMLNNSFVAWGDFDNDNDLDLYISGEASTGDLAGGLYQNNNGTFVLVSNSNLPLLSLGQAQWGDMNGDGNLDLVLMGYNGNDGQTDVYYNNADGTFSAANANLPPAYMGDLFIADVNNDGQPDIGITGIETVNWSNFTKIFLNNNGTFTELTGNNFPAMNFGKMQFADYDNDGYPDFILSGFSDVTSSQYTKLWHNNQNGTFSETTTPFFQSWLGDLEWGDYDNDGNVDLIVSGVGGSSGTERRTTLYHNNGNGSLSVVASANFPGLSHSAIEIADFNGDGDTDIFLTGAIDTPGAGSYYARIFIGHNGNFIEDANINLQAENYGDAEAADYDNDGDMDLVITGSTYNDAPNSTIYRNDTNTSSVDEGKLLEFSIYPNPSQGVVFVKSEKNNLNFIKIMDITGKIVYKTFVEAKQTSLNLTNLPKGIYMMKVNNQGKKLILY